MATRNFFALLQAKWNEGKFLCVGLDSDANKLPESVRSAHATLAEAVIAFNKQIVEATKDLVCAYKPNSAFYEALGAEGVAALEQTVAMIQRIAPDVAVILDAKRGDIDSSNAAYAAATFDKLGADAVTVHGYLGSQALQPFLDYKDKGIFVLCRTSNKGAGEFQDLVVDGMPLYQVIAKRVQEQWNKNGNCGLVVGATYPKELTEIRAMGIDLPLLIPGIGAQGGGIVETVLAGKDSRGQGMIINASRSILFASSGNDFAHAARAEAQRMHEAIQAALR